MRGSDGMDESWTWHGRVMDMAWTCQEGLQLLFVTTKTTL